MTALPESSDALTDLVGDYFSEGMSEDSTFAGTLVIASLADLRVNMRAERVYSANFPYDDNCKRGREPTCDFMTEIYSALEKRLGESVDAIKANKRQGKCKPVTFKEFTEIVYEEVFDVCHQHYGFSSGGLLDAAVAGYACLGSLSLDEIFR